MNCQVVAPNLRTSSLQPISRPFPVLLCICIALHPVQLADGLYTYQGSDSSDAFSDGPPSDNSFYGNIISTSGTGLKIAEPDDPVITGETKLKRELYSLLYC